MKKIFKTKNARREVRKVKTLNTVSKGGRIFSVTFTKKNGDLRVMACRKGVKSYLRGGSNTVSHLPQYMTLFSVNDKGYRNINLTTIQEIKGRGKVYNF